MKQCFVIMPIKKSGLPSIATFERYSTTSSNPPSSRSDTKSREPTTFRRAAPLRRISSYRWRSPNSWWPTSLASMRMCSTSLG